MAEGEQGDEEEEEELFSQLVSEEEKREDLSKEKVVQLMEEGVVEEPHVDSDEAEPALQEHDEPTKEVDSSAVMEGLHAAPSEEELASGEAVVVNSDMSKHDEGDEFVEEQMVDTEEDDGEEGDDEDVANNATPANIISDIDSAALTLTKPQVAGPKTFKMVNTHFLALTDAFTNAGFTRLSDTAFTSSVSVLLTKPVTAVVGSRGKMISQISRSSCLGGTKGAQLTCRSKFATQNGCTFESLKVSPAQYNMWRSEDCERFFEVALKPENAQKQWIGKVGASYHGKHITIYQGVTKSIKSHYGKCKLNKDTGGGYIMMEYIAEPALIEDRKFDLRTFLLIGSTSPYLVFYHRGFVRRSGNKYTTNVNDQLAHITNLAAQKSADHFWGFDTLEQALTKELNFAPDYMKTTFAKHAKLVTNYVFQAARDRLKRREGAYALFGLDWMIDRSGGIHLLEGNGNPVVQHYPGTDDLTPNVWRDMASLVIKIHMDPATLGGPLKKGFTFGGWELVFSEIEEIARGEKYDPCKSM